MADPRNGGPPESSASSSLLQNAWVEISSHDPELWRGSIRGELTMLNRCRFVESTCGGDPRNGGPKYSPIRQRNRNSS